MNLANVLYGRGEMTHCLAKLFTLSEMACRSVAGGMLSHGFLWLTFRTCSQVCIHRDHQKRCSQDVEDCWHIAINGATERPCLSKFPGQIKGLWIQINSERYNRKSDQVIAMCMCLTKLAREIVAKYNQGRQASFTDREAGRITSSDSHAMTTKQCRGANCIPDPTDTLADVQQHLAALDSLLAENFCTT